MFVAVEKPAAASQIDQSASFEAAFSPYEMAENHKILSVQARSKAEMLSESAPREIVPAPVAEPDPAGKSIRSGFASYYGKRFAGRRTANGEIFNPAELTAAHRSLPFGSKVRVTNKRNGQSVIVRINDRGPFSRGRVIDLSREAARKIGLIRAGHGPVELSLL